MGDGGQLIANSPSTLRPLRPFEVVSRRNVRSQCKIVSITGKSNVYIKLLPYIFSLSMKIRK